MAQGKRSVNGAQVFEPRVQAFMSVSQFPSIEVGAKETVSRTLGFQIRRLLEMTQGHGRGKEMNGISRTGNVLSFSTDKSKSVKLFHH